MNNFEEKLKYISQKDFDVPENYEKFVNDALNYISNMQTTSRRIEKKKENRFMSFMQKVASVILIGTLSVTVYAGITGNLSFEKMGLKKLSQNYEENKVALNEKIDSEYFTISLENIARDSAYVILEYKINLKEKALSEFKEITYNNETGYTIGLGSFIELNGEKNPFYIDYTEKESDTVYSYYQIIHAMANDSEAMNLRIWLDCLWTEDSMNEAVQIDEIFEISSKIDNVKELNIEEQKQVLDDGSVLILDKVLNTNFQTFVRVKREINNITYEDFGKNNNLQYKSFLITDNEDNLIPYRTYMSDIIGRKYYLANTGKEIERNDLYKLKKEDIINIEENYVVLLDNVQELNEFKIIPIKFRLYNDRTNEETEMYNKADWYPLTEGTVNYSKQSDLGGTLEITNIKVDNENIILNYNKKGIVENGISYVLIRDKSRKMNYICPKKQDETNSGEILFKRDLSGSSGLEIREGMLDNIENLEFTILFGKVTEFEGKPFETTMPEYSNQKLKIDSINRSKTNTKTIRCTINSNERYFKVEYDKDDNVLGFDGYANDLYYKIDGKTERFLPRDYKKATELVEALEIHLKYKNIEYTIE